MKSRTCMMRGLGALYDGSSLLSLTDHGLFGNAGSRFYDLKILLDGTPMTPRMMPSQVDAYLIPLPGQKFHSVGSLAALGQRQSQWGCAVCSVWNGPDSDTSFKAALGHMELRAMTDDDDVNFSRSLKDGCHFYQGIPSTRLDLIGMLVAN